MKKFYFVVITLSFILSSCQTATPDAFVIQTAIAQTQVALPTLTFTPIPTDTPTTVPTETSTPLPTSTPKPTNTLAPTDTPEPTITMTPAPKPITFKGTGSNVVDVKKWAGAALIKISYKGGSNFVIYNYDANGKRINLLVNTIGNYEGLRPLDFADGNETARLEIKSSGTWEITLLPPVPGTIKILDIPGTMTSKGDDFFAVKPQAGDLAKIEYKSKSNFIVYGYSLTQGKRLLVNEIGPWIGTVMLPEMVAFIDVKSDGEWSIEITTK
jgi:hypothetical protein